MSHRKHLRSTKLPLSSGNQDQQLKALKEIFVLSKGFKPYDVDEINMEVTQLSASKDICLKKLVYLYLSLSSYCSDDMFLHVINSAANDLADPNPIIRSSTLASICEFSVSSDEAFEFLCKAILQGLTDASSSVRCSAINGTSQVYCKVRHCAELLESSTFAAVLKKVSYTIKNDPDPTVVVRSLECLILCKQKAELTNFMLSLLDKVSLLDPCLSLVLLRRASISLDYGCLSVEEVFKILNKLEHLRHLTTSYSLPIESCFLMTKLSAKVENVHKDVVIEFLSSLISFLFVCNKTSLYYILCCLLSVIQLHPSLITNKIVENIKLFFLSSEDSSHVCAKKIAILKHCVNGDTSVIIYNNIRPYFHRANMPNVVKASFELLRALHDFMPEACNNVLLCSLYAEITVIVECSITVLYHLIISAKHNENSAYFSKVTSPLLTCYKHVVSEEAKSCYLFLVSGITDVKHVKILGKIIKTEVLLCPTLTSFCHQHSIIVATCRLYFTWPSFFQSQVKEILSKIFKCGHHSFVREQAKIYYTLLRDDPSSLRDLLTFTKPCLFSSAKKFGKKCSNAAADVRNVAVKFT